MAGEHTRIGRDIWSSDEFLDLSRAAQHLYFVLWTHPTRSFCGSIDWHPGRLATFAADLTPELVIESAIELSRTLFIAVDQQTDEALIRSWIKHDGLYRQPNMAVAMAKDRAGLASRGLRGIVVHEVAKLRASEPDLSGWKRDQVVNLLGQKAVDPADYWAASPWSNPSGNPSVKGSVNPSGNPPDNPHAKGAVNPGPTTATTPSSPDSNYKESGSVSTEGNDAHEVNTPPPIRCATHIDNPTTAACRPCGDARKSRQAWDAMQVEASKRARSAEIHEFAHATALAIADCGLCDEHGYLGTIVCDHDPGTVERAGRGMELVRREMGWEA